MPVFDYIPPGHLDSAGVSPPPSCLNTRGLQSRGSESYSLTTTHQQLQYLCMIESLHRFPIDVSDQVPRSESSIEGRASLVHLHHEMVNSEEVGVPEIYSDGSDCEAEAPWTAPDDDRRFE